MRGFALRVLNLGTSLFATNAHERPRRSLRIRRITAIAAAANFCLFSECERARIGQGVVFSPRRPHLSFGLSFDATDSCWSGVGIERIEVTDVQGHVHSIVNPIVSTVPEQPLVVSFILQRLKDPFQEVLRAAGDGHWKCFLLWYSSLILM